MLFCLRLVVVTAIRTMHHKRILPKAITVQENSEIQESSNIVLKKMTSQEESDEQNESVQENKGETFVAKS